MVNSKIAYAKYFCTRDDLNDSLTYFIFMFGNDITIFLYVRGDVIFLKTEMQHRVSSVHYSLLKCGLMYTNKIVKESSRCENNIYLSFVFQYTTTAIPIFPKEC